MIYIQLNQSSSYKSIDDNDFVNKGDGNDNRSNKNRSSSEFHVISLMYLS